VPDHRPPRTLSAIRAIAAVVVLEALRGRIVWLMLALVLAGFALAQFTAAVTITESVAIAMGTFALWLRTAAVCVVALFVSASMMRDWNDKGMELVLALALPRAVYLYGRLGGYALVALGCALMCSAALLLFIPWQQAAIWGATLALELLLVAALAVLCLLTLTHVTIGISAVAAFYVLARSMDAIRLIGANPIAGGNSDAHGLMVFVLDTVAYLLPDLTRFARSEWIIFANATLSDLGFAAGQCAIYLTLLVAAAMFDLQRKVL
jgi:hypothetical protein